MLDIPLGHEPFVVGTSINEMSLREYIASLDVLADITERERARRCDLYVKFVADSLRVGGGSELMKDLTGDLMAGVVVGLSRMTGASVIEVINSLGVDETAE